VKLVLRNPAPLQAGVRLERLDEIKGFALALVIYYHIGGVLGWRNWLHGEVGVDIFLLVSGFTLALHSSGQTWGRFVTRRLLRIFPAYWLALLVFAVARLEYFNVKPDPTSLWLHILGVHAFAPGKYFSDFNDSFWFISLILGLYVVFLFVRRWLHDISVVFGIGLILTTVACFSYIAADHGGGLIELAVRIPSFFIGLAAGQLCSAPETIVTCSPPLALGLLGLALLAWLKGVITFYPVAAAGLLGIFVVLSDLARPKELGAAALRCFQFLGVYSYEIYLFHQPLIREYNQFVWRRLTHAEADSWQLEIGIVFALAFTLFLSIAVHKTTVWAFREIRGDVKPVTVPHPATAT
jgi:peptidoglycan/LPS O-acetylase OafA/YrhL